MDPFHQIRPLLDWMRMNVSTRVGGDSASTENEAVAMLKAHIATQTRQREQLALDVWNSKGPLR